MNNKERITCEKCSYRFTIENNITILKCPNCSEIIDENKSLEDSK